MEQILPNSSHNRNTRPPLPLLPQMRQTSTGVNTSTTIDVHIDTNTNIDKNTNAINSNNAEESSPSSLSSPPSITNNAKQATNKCRNVQVAATTTTTMMMTTPYKTKAAQKFKYNWEENYIKLKQYMKEQQQKQQQQQNYSHSQSNSNNTPIPKNTNNKSLLKWMNQQKREYRELQSKGISKLSSSQLQRLNDIGFKFTSRRKYGTWEERMNEFQEFTKLYHHGRVPVQHPTLGSWVHEQRRQYKLFIQKDARSKMTAGKINILKKAGFIFEIAKKSQLIDARSNSKSWEERYNELKLFKVRNGHTLVPQHYPRLGWWVNTQRKEHKKLITGKKSALTSAKVLKLVELDFVFDASGKKGNTGNRHEGTITAITTSPLRGTMLPTTGFATDDNVERGGEFNRNSTFPEQTNY
jgi:hypothetical protein